MAAFLRWTVAPQSNALYLPPVTTYVEPMTKLDAKTQVRRHADGSVDVYDARGVWLGWADPKGEVMSTGFIDRERYVPRIEAAWRAVHGVTT